jgi:aldehyde dehydrogenase (NAD+)
MSQQRVVEEIPRIVQSLRKAFNSGITRSYEWREGQLKALGRFLSENRDQLYEVLKKDLGKPRQEAFLGELTTADMELKHVLHNLHSWMQPKKVSTPLAQIKGLSTSHLVPEPKGIVLVISPWNYPIQLPLVGLITAIAAGNCVLLKPSEISEHCSRFLAEQLPKYMDNNCIQVFYGGIPETTTILKERFDHILYTGNGNVAKVIMRAAAEHLTPVTLELGGKSPCIVDKDVDLDVATRRIIWGKYFNAGQTCIGVDYVLVHKDMKAKLVESLQQCLKQFYGDDPKLSPDFARIVNKRHWQRVAQLVDASKGNVVVGGQKDPDQLYIAPTIIVDVAPDAPVMKEEIFGPVMPIRSVDSIDEAIEFINERPKPLAMYIFTRNSYVWDDVISRTSAGGVCVNDTLMQYGVPSLPFGGVGDSGCGAYHGEYGFNELSHNKAVLNKTTWFDMMVRYPPYTDSKMAALSKFA